MATANDTIRRALRLATIIGQGDVIQPDYIDSAIQALNEMLFRWEADGLDLNHTTVTALGETLTVPDSALDVIAFNLAARIGVEYNAPIPDKVISHAEYLYTLALTGVISPSSVAATTTAAAAIDRAMRLCGIARTGDANRGTYQLAGLKALNDMMTRWEGNGLATGYAALTSTASVIGVAEKFVDPIVFNLAVGIAPEYNKQLPPEIVRRAQLLYQQAVEDAANVTSLPTTAQGIIQRAIRLAQIPASKQTLYFTSGLQALNEMLHRWEANGISMGFSGLASLATAHGLPDEALKPVTFNLAVELALENGLTPQPSVQQIAADSYRDIWDDATMIRTVYITPYLEQ